MASMTATGCPTAAMALALNSDGPTTTSDNGRSAVAQPTVVTPTLIDLTQDEEHSPAYTFTQQQEEEETEHHTLVGSCDFTVVGIRFYKGVARPGEFINLSREPTNPYDRNAIRVDNLRGEKVGHIKREQAAILAPVMDQATRYHLTLEANIPRQGNAYVLPLSLDFYAVSEIAADVPADTTELGRTLQTTFGGQFGFRLARNAQPPRPEQQQVVAVIAAPPPVVQTRSLDWQIQAEELDEMFDRQTSAQLKDLPDIPQSTMSLLADHVKLFDYQSLGIRWMVHQETKPQGTIVPFFKQVQENSKQMWLCEITQSSQTNPPKSIKGGILADEMGLGKTLQTIGLILSAPPEGRNYSSGEMVKENAPVDAEPDATRTTTTTPTEDEQVPSERAIRSLRAVALKRILQSACLSGSGKKDMLLQRVLDGVQSKTLTGEHFPPELLSKEKASTSTLAPPRPADGTTSTHGGICTLIACPVSVMSNWEQQIKAHVKPNVLKVAFYQGPNRGQILPDLNAGGIDVLLVSYHTLAAEFKTIYGTDGTKDGEPVPKKRKQESIFDATFHRFVLDEAHTIRSTKASFFKSVQQIKADRKLAMTGTPFVNRADDVHSLLAFIGVEPLADKNLFKRAITIPIQSGHDIGLSRLRTTMAHVALRRSKAMANIKLPNKEVHLRSVTFPENSHKAVYDALFGTIRAAFEAFFQDQDDQHLLKNYSSIFEKLLRMRQSCCSATLVPTKRREAAIALWAELQKRDTGTTLTTEEGLALLEKLKGAFTQDDEQLPECAVCLTEMDEQDCIILRTCSHVYCEPCISRVASSQNSGCPLCRKPFSKGDIVKKSTAMVVASQEITAPTKANIMDEDIETSPKILALLEAIKDMKSDEKGVIFSQFTSFLNLIGQALTSAGHSFTRIDGSMNAGKRVTAVSSFCSNDEASPRFILCSLHAAGTGINLTRGNYAFMMDCWWNQAVELQAMDRIHRIGQERKVYIIRFVMKHSIEERMVALQEAKSMQAKGAMQKLNPEEQRKARLNDLKGLLLLEDGNE